MLAAIKWGVGFVLLAAVSVPINGLLISATWGWFVSPITGARQITISEGIGLAIFCSIIGTVATAHLKEWDFGDATDDWRKIAAKAVGAAIGIGVVGPILVLAWAWAWHTFFM
jgi:hypothetical protein